MNGEVSPFAIRVRRLPVRLVTVGGERLEAEAFLHDASDHHPGPESLLERLNEPGRPFLPCDIGGEVQLVHLERVAYVELPGRPIEVRRGEDLGASHLPCQVHLVSGEVVQGEAVDLIRRERSRLSDLLNLSARFFTVASTEVTRYVHRAAVVRVQD